MWYHTLIMPAFRREQRINSLEPAWPTEGSKSLSQTEERGEENERKSITFKSVGKIQISTKIMRFIFKYLASMAFNGVFSQLFWLETTESTLCCSNKKGFMLLAPGHKMLGSRFFKFGIKSNLHFIPHRVVKQQGLHYLPHLASASKTPSPPLPPPKKNRPRGCPVAVTASDRQACSPQGMLGDHGLW